MSYQVLARKWRPKNFQELMGQEHVVAVLANALSQQRLHHAYLFTGTRGVGKTTIARIFAKSLNCDTGITDKPCGVCDACVDIDQGRFIDLLEIDAASKTKVDDTREILDNVQYAPSRGRYKVYLIDEVHMLSRHSFNALLKTLEEPPEHVKFILATTDPQKLPITVLSRCLQFHLKALNVKQIETKLTEILTHEDVTHEAGSLTLLAKAARGSMRDSLSLTDQAIAQGRGNITLSNIQQMLGGIDQNWVFSILIHLLKQDSKSLIALSQEIASYAPSYSRLFAELIQLFHQIALMQVVEQSFTLPADQLELLKKFSLAMSPEDVQLYYQIAVNGRKDLPYAADEQAAFDMTLLRLLAFKPMQLSDVKNTEHNISAPVGQSPNFDVNELKIAESTAPDSNIAVIAQEQIAQSSITEVVHEDTVDAISVDEIVIDKRIEKSELESVKHSFSEQSESNLIDAENTVESDSATETLAAEMLAIEAQAKQYNEAMPQESSDEVSEQYNHEVQSSSQAISQQTNQSPSQLSTQSGYSGHLEQNPVNNIVENNNESLVVEAPSAEVTIAELPANEPLPINSPISSVLATRNMLRSRKKQLESQPKKSNGAKERQQLEKHATTSTTNTLDSNKVLTTEPEVIIPEPEVIIPEPVAPYQPESIDPSVVRKANQVDKWAHMIDSMQLSARIRQLAIHATISDESTDDNLILLLDQATRHLNSDVAQEQLQAFISEFLGRKVTVTLTIVESTVADPFQIQAHINDKRYDYAKALLKEDPIIVELQNKFQAVLDEETINAH
jgi:DNA polymerase-3 subunit gamma/tau